MESPIKLIIFLNHLKNVRFVSLEFQSNKQKSRHNSYIGENTCNCLKQNFVLENSFETMFKQIAYYKDYHREENVEPKSRIQFRLPINIRT